MTGRALRSIRLALSLSIQDFAARIGIPASDVDAYERGDKAIDNNRLSAALERLVPAGSLEATDSLLAPANGGNLTRNM